MLRFIIVLLSFVLLAAKPAKAEDFIEWQTANIQLLKGWDYEVGEEERALITFEYANRWRYGDFFMFIDGTRYDSGGTKAYGEFSPRISLGRVFDEDLSYGIIKDVLISGTFEKGKGDVEAHLIGGAIDLNLPGFTFFKTNLYLRSSPNLEKDTWQVTLCWNHPFEINDMHFLAEGFADFAGNAGPRYSANQFVVPRLLLDVGDLLGKEKGKLYAGIEYSYWHNKFGIEGKTESLPQLQLKWVF